MPDGPGAVSFVVIQSMAVISSVVMGSQWQSSAGLGSMSWWMSTG